MRFTSPGEAVWAIGDPELGPRQFPPALLMGPDPTPPVFMVGQGDPATDRPKFQSGLELADNLGGQGQRHDVVVRVQDVSGAGRVARLDPAFVGRRVVHLCPADEARSERIDAETGGGVLIQVGPRRVVTLSVAEPEPEEEHG